MAVRIERDEGPAEINSIGAWMIGSPRAAQLACMPSTSVAMNAISVPPPAAAAAGLTVWRDHSPNPAPPGNGLTSRHCPDGRPRRALSGAAEIVSNREPIDVSGFAD